MTPEERQNIQKLEEAQVRADKRVDRLERIAGLMVRAGLRARRNMREQDERITTLVDSQLRTEEIARHNSEDIAALITTTERNSQAISRLEEVTERSSENISRIEEITQRNSESISQLAEIVRQLATRQNGNGTDGA